MLRATPLLGLGALLLLGATGLDEPEPIAQPETDPTLVNVPETSEEFTIPGSRERAARKNKANHLNSRTAWTDSSCGSCHLTEKVFSHAVGTIPSMNVPASLPLEDGRMTCATCHTNESSADHTQARNAGLSLLRGGLTSRTLCLECHSANPGSQRDQHAMMLSRAHLQWPKNTLNPRMSQKTNEKKTATRELISFDRESTNCLSCHDDAMTGAFSSGSKGHFGFQGMVQQEDHPIGVEFREFRKRALVAPSNLDPRIRLFDNRVGCGSCHSPYSQEERLLVMTNRFSRLCLSCHDL